MSIRQQQETLSKMFEIAEDYAKRGEYQRARRALVCAAAKMLEIAESATASAKPAIEKKAYTIVKESVKISSVTFDDLLDDFMMDGLSHELDIDDEEPISTKSSKGVTFDQVVGLDDVKDTINRQIIYPMKYPTIYNRYLKKSGGGILLYGLPGTGKTMIAKAIANEIRAKFIHVKCSDILSKWLGESERKIKELFEDARKSKRSIIFFDEFEALSSTRGKHGNAMDQIVPELLVQMQGFEELKNVVIICATNRPWDIDSAFMRPGRLTNRIYVSLPTRAQRLELLEKKLDGVPLEENIDFDTILDMTKQYSGADMEELCDYAKNYAIDREIASGEESCLTLADIEASLKHVKSSIRREDILEMERYKASYDGIIEDIGDFNIDINRMTS